MRKRSWEVTLISSSVFQNSSTAAHQNNLLTLLSLSTLIQESSYPMWKQFVGTTFIIKPVTGILHIVKRISTTLK
jgi:hypothetical protein